VNDRATTVAPPSRCRGAATSTPPTPSSGRLTIADLSLRCLGIAGPPPRLGTTTLRHHAS